jgi:regulatory protein spx
MNKEIDIFCWNNCNTCLQTKKYLIQKGYKLNDRDFFKQPFTKTEMLDLLKDHKAEDMFNSRSPSVKALGLNADTIAADEMIEMMLEEPRLVKRPIVRINGQVYFGANSRLLETILT